MKERCYTDWLRPAETDEIAVPCPCKEKCTIGGVMDECVFYQARFGIWTRQSCSIHGLAWHLNGWCYTCEFEKEKNIDPF